jgi:hypothetical protein
MKFSWNGRRLTVAAVVVCLFGANATLVRSQGAKIVTSADAQTQTHSVEDKDAAYYRQFLDKDGGYKDSKGGYYNPKAGTYTDEVGGVVDNWGGYTYRDGSYKSKLGDFYDGKTNVFKLADGETVKVEAGISRAQAIQFLRENVEQNGGYDKELIRRSMMQQIKLEHPNPPHR